MNKSAEVYLTWWNPTTHIHSHTYTHTHTVVLGQHCVWHEGIGVTVSQLIPGVLSDGTDPQGPPLLLRIQHSIRHLSYPLKHKCVCVCILHACLCGHICVSKSSCCNAEFQYNYFPIPSSDLLHPPLHPFCPAHPNLLATCHCGCLPD